MNASLGYYLSDTLELVVRQSGSYSDGAGGDTEFDGSTFVAVDHHFGSDRLRPFVGVNLGRVSGGSIEHLHVHLVPRWQGDTNFMPIVADTKVLVELLRDTYARFEKAFGRDGA